MDLRHFSIGFGVKIFLIGIVQVLGMQKLREKNEVADRAGA